MLDLYRWRSGYKNNCEKIILYGIFIERNYLTSHDRDDLL